MTIRPTMSRRTVLIWLLLSSAISVGWGYWIGYTKNAGFGDFRAVYFAARTALAHKDPYNPTDFLQVYQHEGGEIPTDPLRAHLFRRAITVCVNLPSTLLVVAPVALLRWTPAELLWMVLMPAGFLLSAWLIWDLSGRRAPRITLFLLCIVLADCQVLLQLGNASGMSVILGVIAVWCFVKKRCIPVGVLCMTLGLAIKPQEMAFIWLYFLLAGGTFRRRAWQIMAVTLVLVALSVAWVSHVSPNWVQEWRANAASTTAHGDLNDPGPASIGNTKLGMIISLQSVLGFFRDDPAMYNPVTWFAIGIPILIWSVITLRSHASETGIWLGIASISALSLLPVYHRQYDAKLLLLCIPALTVLWEQGSPLRKPALLVTSAGILLTADIPLAILNMVNKALHLSQNEFAGKVIAVLLTRTSTFVLAITGVFYLWAYVRHALAAMVETGDKTNADLEMTTPLSA
jgi:hypothetical protein